MGAAAHHHLRASRSIATKPRGCSGFEGLAENSYGAIAAIDYMTEAAAAVAVAMVNLGKLTQDLLLWSTREFGFLRLSDAFVQSSSIMPQKRNPVALEHARILASRALGEAQAVLTCAHNTPFGDINDSEDDLQPLVFTMFAGRSEVASPVSRSAAFRHSRSRSTWPAEPRKISSPLRSWPTPWSAPKA